jgi:glycosyltransferase involved in cell wall biosynthesis
MRRMLFFIPDNPLKKNSGNKVRALELLKYFKLRGFELDFVSEQSWGEWTPEDIADFKASGLATNSYIINRKGSKKNLLTYFLFYKLPNFFNEIFSGRIIENFPDLVTIRLKSKFNALLKANSYDYIFINYASWSSLIEDNKNLGKAITILDTHDFLTAQNQDRYDIGESFKEEIRRISLFDQAFAISVEEQYIFSQFSKTQISLIPMMIRSPSTDAIEFENRLYDIIYVASNNPHNVKAFQWFLKEVYPLLPLNLSICVIGQITSLLDDKYPKITKIPFAENLDSFYQEARVAICPMLTGTGVKIKVVEALSYGLPVVCNTRGVDGLLNKTDNGCMVTDDPKEFATNIHVLLNDENIYNKQSEFAKHTFLSNYESSNCYKKLDKFFNI